MSRTATFRARAGVLSASLLASTVFFVIGAPPATADPTYAVVTGPGPGGPPIVRTFTSSAAPFHELFAYFPDDFAGVSVASGDISGDEHPDIITGPGPGNGPHVKGFDGDTGQFISSFFAYPTGFRGGVNVAAGDVNGDGLADIITGAGPGGGPHVKVFDGDTGEAISSFFAYPSGFRGGVNVAAGDVNGDGLADIITGAGAGGGPHVKAFDGDTGEAISSFFAYPSGFRGGVNVAAGDVNGDGLADIITGAGAGGGPHVKAFDSDTGTAVASFFAYNATFRGGVYVGAAEVVTDGFADIVTGAGRGGGPHVKVFDGDDGSAILSFFAYPPDFRGGVRVAGNLGTHPPVVEVTGGPANESMTADSTPTYTGTATDSDGIVLDVAVSVDFGEFTTDGVVCTDCGTDVADWEFTPTAPLPDGEHVFIFAAFDNSGLIGFDVRTVGIDVVPGPPTVTVNQAAGQDDPTNDESIEFTAVFSEPVTGFTIDGVQLSGTGDPPKNEDNVVITGGPTTYTISISGMTQDGTVTVGLSAGAAEDGAGNPSLASTSSDNTVTFDSTAPTFDQIAASNSTTVFAYFSEALACGSVQTSDFIASVAGSPVAVNAVGCTGASDDVIELTLASAPTQGQSVSVSLVGDVTDPAGNAAPTATRNTTADATDPTVTVEQDVDQDDPTNNAPIAFDVTFSEPVIGLTAGDFDVSGTAPGAQVTGLGGGPTVYQVGVSGMTGDGTVILDLPASVVTDLAGNPNAASTSTDNEVTYDVTSPTATVNQAAAQADPTITSPINFTAVFSEPMGGFDGTGVTITGTAGGTKSAVITGAGTTWNIAVSGMTTPGTVIVAIPGDTWFDLAGNFSAPSTSTDNTVTWDTRPTVTVNQAAAQADPTNDDPINFTATFNEAVTGFTDGDVTIGGTAGGTLTADVTGGPTVYNIAISGMTTDGTVTASVNAGVAADANGFTNLASTSTDNTVTWDTTAPTFDWLVTSAGSSTVTAVFGSADDPILCSSVSTSDFLAAVNGPPASVTAVGCSGTADATIQLTLSAAPAAGQTTNVQLAGIVTDKAGNVVAGDTHASIASSPAVIVSGGPADGGSTSDRTPTYSGNAGDGSRTVEDIEVSTDGGLTFSTAGVLCVTCGVANFVVSWSYTPTSALAPGTYTFVFRAVDDDGGFSAPIVRRLTIT